MIRTTAATVLRRISASASLQNQRRRQLAIMPTVKVAPDTSAIEFPAPSHVSISSEAADLAKQLADFYSDPDSVISIPEDARDVIQSEVEKKVKAIPESSLPEDYAASKLRVPSEIRIGDNPLFDAYSKSRTSTKLD